MLLSNRQSANTDKELTLLIKQSGDRNASKREQARREIVAVVAEHPQRLTTLLFWVERDLRGVRRLLRVFKFVIIGAALFLVRYLVQHRWSAAFELLCHIAPVLLAITMPLNERHRLKSLLDTMAGLQDKRFIGLLLEAYPYQEVRSSIVKTLLGLLPQLQHSDTNVLNEQQRAILYQSLHDKNTEWTRTVLKALEQIGDDKAVPYVEKLIADSKTEIEVREAAQECLLYLRRRLEQLQMSRALLRASDSTAASPDTLLRAGIACTDTAPHQLLRPDNAAASVER